MEDLATLLDDRRINVSRMLNELQAEGLVTLRRKEIEIPALEKLY
jgi:CRP-like cAMP-binding protein